jgi:PAS domain S-box-containing protein
LRQVFADMRVEEVRLDGARDAAYRRSVRITIASVYLATFAAILGLILVARFILRVQALREKHAHELRLREEWFRTTLTSIGDAVIATDCFGNVTFMNPEAERLTGYRFSGATGKNIAQVFPIFSEVTGKEAQDPVRKAMELNGVVGLANHTVLKAGDGSLIPIEDSAAPIRDDQGALVGVVLVFRDVTADRKAQEVMRRTEKLAAAARLAATVAHEINNPLAAVVNLVFVAKNTPGVPDSALQHLLLAEQELERVAHITRQTLAFYRESTGPEEFRVADLVDSVLKLYSNRLAAKEVRVVRAIDDCPAIVGVVGELRQATSNLIANAIDSVSRNGHISVEAHPVSAGEGCMVEMIVADDGPGIPPENRQRIFEPFFTTKKDVGTGLGLWSTKTIVERHGGTITVAAQQDGNRNSGVAFVVRLPCSSGAAKSK